MAVNKTPKAVPTKAELDIRAQILANKARNPEFYDEKMKDTNTRVGYDFGLITRKAAEEADLDLEAFDKDAVVWKKRQSVRKAPAALQSLVDCGLSSEDILAMLTAAE